MTKSRVVHCPECGHKLRQISELVDPNKKCMGILEYDVCCDNCNTTVTIEDMSSFEQEGKITITFE